VPLTLTLYGGTPCDVGVRVDVLKTLLTRADTYARYVAEMRQKLLNYSLLVFGAVIAFSTGRIVVNTNPQADIFNRRFAAYALVAVMLVFTYLDVHLHKYGHGWRRTAAKITQALVILLGHTMNTQ
jgi:hypothetical protein